ncbi:MAG: type II toxin-antitoxin system RelE/ParE family toxin [Methylococcus sp.]|nr:type II toxin-antitoxin system RelE/ParE family toxin [Methylococcus sp.]
MPVIRKSSRAKSDLIEIWEYIAEDSEVRADAFIDRIDKKFRTLAQRPGIGRLRDELAEDLRGFPIGRYVIFYLPLAHGIEIVRTLCGRRPVRHQSAGTVACPCADTAGLNLKLGFGAFSASLGAGGS